jgi:hypothetical protein
MISLVPALFCASIRAMPTLKAQLETIASSFASAILDAIRGASLEDLVVGAGEETGRRPGRPRSVSGDGSTTIPIKVRGGGTRYIDRDVLALTGLLSTRPGLRAEQIRAHLRWDKKTTTKAITMALNEKRVTKQGQKRATTYFYAP